MNMETRILSTIYSSEMYEKVKFLRSEDFTDPINAYYWKIIQEYQGSYRDVVRKSKDMLFLDRYLYITSLPMLTNLTQCALRLVQDCFQEKLFSTYELLGKQNTHFNHALELFKQRDFMKYLNVLVKYSEPYCSKEELDHITKLENYFAKRMNIIKHVIG